MSDPKRVLIPLAPGFEELEAVALIDVLRRGGLDVVVAGLDGAGPVTGSHDIVVHADAALAEVDAEGLDAVVLPGGMPGTTNLAADARVLAIVRALRERDCLTAAICAAPMVLHAAGVIAGVRVTSHPSVRDRLDGADVQGGPRVLQSGTIWTSQGPGTALEFGLAIVGALVGENEAEGLRDAMLVAIPGA